MNQKQLGLIIDIQNHNQYFEVLINSYRYAIEYGPTLSSYFTTNGGSMKLLFTIEATSYCKAKGYLYGVYSFTASGNFLPI